MYRAFDLVLCVETMHVLLALHTDHDRAERCWDERGAAAGSLRVDESCRVGRPLRWACVE